MVSERSVLRPQSMDEMEQQIMFEMSENLQKQKQSTEAIKFQIKELLQSQAKLQAKLIESQKNLETVMPRFFSQTSIPLRPPSQPPDPPDFDKSNLKFDGKLIDGTLLSEWVLRCEQFFMKNNIPPEQKVRIISIHMEGEAFHWHCDFIRNRFGIFPSWTDYIVALSARFGKLFDDPLSELMSLKQCGDSVETYLEKFDRALSRLSLSMPHAVNIFLSNMNPHLASHVKQFDVTTVAYAAWVAKLFEPSLLHTTAIQPRAPFSPYQNQNNQFHYNSPNTTSSLPLLETTKLPYKPNIPTETDMEKSPKKLCCEEIQESGMTGMCMSSDGSCHLESKKSQIFVKECEDASMSGDEASHATNSVLEKETIPSSALCQRVPVTLSQNNNVTQQEELNYDMETIVENGLVQEHESLGFTDSVLKVDCVHSQEFSSQFQVPNPSLEPSRRCHKESLVVVNDLSYDHGCVTGKTIGSICDFELGQDNSLDEEEFKGFKLGKLSKNERRLSAVCLLEKKEVTKTISAWNNRVWEPGGVLIEIDRWKELENCYKHGRLMRLMHWMSSMTWKETKSREFARLSACSCVVIKTWHCVEHETQQTDFRVWHRWKNKAEKFPTNCAFLEFMMLDLVSFQPNKGNGVVGLVPKTIVLREVSHCRSNDYGTIRHKLLSVRDTSSDGYKEDSWSSIWFILKELCSARFERKKETIKKDFKELSKLEKDHKIEATVLVFLGHIFGIEHKITSGWIKDQEQGVNYEWPLRMQALQAVKDHKDTNYVSNTAILGVKGKYDPHGRLKEVMVQRQWETFMMMLLSIAESLILLSDPFIFAEKKGIEISISCCYGTSSVDMQFSTALEIMSKQQHFIQLPNLPRESSHDDADRILQKREEHITSSAQNTTVTKALIQWKEHPPDQSYLVLNGKNLIFHP